jgi:O-antigen/teichoic acid export membrane protein
MSGLTARIAASVGSRGWTALLQLAVVPFYIHFLGVEAYGLVGAFLTLQALISLLDLGLGPTLTRELARLSSQPNSGRKMRDLLRSLEIVYWAISIAVGLLICFLAPYIAHYWLKPVALSRSAISHAIVIAGVAFALIWPANLYYSGFLGLERQVTLGWIVAAIGTVRPAVTLAALWLIAPTLDVFFAAQACVNLLQTLVVAVLLWRCLPKAQARASFRPGQVRALLRFATGVTGIGITTVVLTQLDKAVLSKTLTLSSFGYYAVAGTLAAGLYVLVTPIFTVFFPRFSQLVACNDRDSLQKLYSTSSQLLAVMICPVAATACFFSWEILRLWTHNAAIADNGSWLLALLVLGNAMNGMMTLPYALQLAYGWTSLAFYANIAAIALCAPLVYILSQWIGAVGGAAVWVFLTFGYLVVGPPLTHRRLLPHRLGRWYLVDVGQPAVAAFAVSASAWLVVPFPAGTASQVIALICLIVAGWAAAAAAAPDVRRILLRRASEVNLAV